jgi:hypothetical protein
MVLPKGRIRDEYCRIPSVVGIHYTAKAMAPTEANRDIQGRPIEWAFDFYRVVLATLRTGGSK